MSHTATGGLGTVDLAIVGAGVAGCYVAHRVAAARQGWQIVVLEGSQRVGGRLLSLRVPGIARVRAELGGMRFRTSQPLVSGLVKELSLETRSFRTVFDENRFFLRGARWQASEPGVATSVYEVVDEEANRSPAELLLMAFERAVPGALGRTDEQWLDVKRVPVSHRGGSRCSCGRSGRNPPRRRLLLVSDVHLRLRCYSASRVFVLLSFRVPRASS